MLNLNVRIDVPREVLHLSETFEGRIDKLHDAAALYLSDAYKYYIYVVGAVDTGELLGSVHIEEGPSGGGDHIKYIVAGADHAMVVETGWILRAQGQASYPGRFPAQRALEHLLQGLENGEVLEALEWRIGR